MNWVVMSRRSSGSRDQIWAGVPKLISPVLPRRRCVRLSQVRWHLGGNFGATVLLRRSARRSPQVQRLDDLGGPGDSGRGLAGRPGGQFDGVDRAGHVPPGEDLLPGSGDGLAGASVSRRCGRCFEVEAVGEEPGRLSCRRPGPRGCCRRGRRPGPNGRTMIRGHMDRRDLFRSAMIRWPAGREVLRPSAPGCSGAGRSRGPC